MPENSASFPQLKEQEDSKDGKVIIDYMLDLNYKPEVPDPNDGPVIQEEEKGDCNAKYAKLKLPHLGTNKQRSMHHQIRIGSGWYMKHKDQR